MNVKSQIYLLRCRVASLIIVTLALVCRAQVQTINKNIHVHDVHIMLNIKKHIYIFLNKI